jgi:hypothetical protein
VRNSAALTIWDSHAAKVARCCTASRVIEPDKAPACSLFQESIRGQPNAGCRSSIRAVFSQFDHEFAGAFNSVEAEVTARKIGPGLRPLGRRRGPVASLMRVLKFYVTNTRTYSFGVLL